MANQAMVQQRPSEQLAVSGTFSDTNAITAMLERRGKDFHLVSPTTECSQVPEGCSVSFAAVLVDVDNETYPESGRRALHRVALDKIGAAAGISWDPRASGRIDDRSDPLYCLFRAVGVIRAFDGTSQILIGTKEFDVREGSPIALDCIARGKPGELAMMRRHLTSHAETKARLRAIASLGIRRSYSAKELEKPFVCAKLAFTGETSDPELRRAFALRRADAMLGASAALFGGGAPLLPEAAPTARGIAPPPVGFSAEDAEFESTSAPQRAVPVAGPYVPPPAPPPQQNAAPPPPPAAQTQRGPAAPPGPSRQEPMPYGGAQGQRAAPPAAPRGAPVGTPTGRSGLVIPGKGPNAGMPVEEAADDTLTFWTKRIGARLEDGTAYRNDQQLFDAMCKEIERRAPGLNPDDEIPF